MQRVGDGQSVENVEEFLTTDYTDGKEGEIVKVFFAHEGHK